MSLFGNKKQPLPDLITESDFEDVANYNSALSFLVGLSDDDYKKVINVADIHRKAYQESAAVLGIANDPTTFINPPEPTAPADEPDFLDEIAKPDKPANSRKINVKE
jgi:hypothetical protein